MKYELFDNSKIQTMTQNLKNKSFLQYLALSPEKDYRFSEIQKEIYPTVLFQNF